MGTSNIFSKRRKRFESSKDFEEIFLKFWKIYTKFSANFEQNLYKMSRKLYGNGWKISMSLKKKNENFLEII